jgi:hypothetical protein
MPAAVELLSTESALASRIAADARSFVEADFDWHAIGTRVIERYRELKARREGNLAARS